MKKKGILKMPSIWSVVTFSMIGFMDLFIVLGVIILPLPMIVSLTGIMGVIGVILRD